MRRVLDAVETLARCPAVRSDYEIRDDSGRVIHHMLVDDFVFTYWIDDAVCEVRILDIEDAS